MRISEFVGEVRIFADVAGKTLYKQEVAETRQPVVVRPYAEKREQAELVSKHARKRYDDEGRKRRPYHRHGNVEEFLHDVRAVKLRRLDYRAVYSAHRTRKHHYVYAERYPHVVEKYCGYSRFKRSVYRQKPVFGVKNRLVYLVDDTAEQSNENYAGYYLRHKQHYFERTRKREFLVDIERENERERQPDKEFARNHSQRHRDLAPPLADGLKSHTEVVERGELLFVTHSAVGNGETLKRDDQRIEVDVYIKYTELQHRQSHDGDIEEQSLRFFRQNFTFGRL